MNGHGTPDTPLERERAKVAMNDEAVRALARYFTCGAVASNSIALALDGQSPLRKAADAFFACRAALGLYGYPSEEEARLTIARAVGGL